ncbi:MAG: helicase-exonuclease AddAB subunit AddA [Lachnospiraceae bacterium]|nr:helicase-exonuclease AddAB subunit AddA [Lachnospiraceae bacterium]
MKFTEDQQKVIDSRNKNVLVAAAAGSGKTAVLVERIIERVCDSENPIDIDRILVVTFTNAAAAEMKERIRDALEAAADAAPEDEHLKRQRSLIHAAHIMTIDSFCRMVIRDNFDRIGIDPQFRVADTSELELMQEDAMSEVLEESYDEASEEFGRFLEEFSASRDDSDVMSAISALFAFSRSKSNPDRWITDLLENYSFETKEELMGGEWMKLMLSMVRDELKDTLRILETARSIAEEPGGPGQYIETLDSDIDGIETLLAAESYEAMRIGALNQKFATLSRKRGEDVDEGKKERVKALRDVVKTSVNKLKDKWLVKTPEEIFKNITAVKPLIEEIIRLTLRFSEKFGELKENKNVIDFADLEHMALQILETDAGEEYKEYFEEIMTDEYQDSNSVQEAILTAVARDNNYFCVGDVKQSIYSFRLAEPEIFVRRYNFSETDEKSERIVLSKNFRSREEVIDAVNAVFRPIMHENIGGVEYDEDASLYYGADYSDTGVDHTAELELITADSDGEIDSTVLEAREVASRIKEMAGSYMVEDRKTKTTHKAEYRDFVILLRSLSGVDEVYAEQLEAAGIPVYIESRTGYFQTEEIRTMISFIMVLDNPRQDIPLSSLMKSVIGSFTDAEMAEIRQARPEGCFYDALRSAAGEMELEENAVPASDGLKNKSILFLKMIKGYREESTYLPIHTLIEKIIDETDYGIYAETRGGSARANLDMLIQRAADYEATSYKGLFFFIRYIEKMKKFDMDFGEASGTGDEANAVRIMSIHKSKGLEFPVVFVSNLSKQFNMRDLSGKLIMDSELGISTDRTDPETRIRSGSMLKNVIAEKRRRALIGEELRVFYVAMTRAEEKLIMTAVVKDPEKKLEGGGTGILHASSFLDFVIEALDSGEISKQLDVIVKNIAKEAEEAVMEAITVADRRSMFERIDTGNVYDEAVRQELGENLLWKYSHEKSFEVPVKVSVSRLKQAQLEEMQEAAVSNKVIIEDEAEEPEAEEKKSSRNPELGALRGTAYHKAFELIDIDKIHSLKDVFAYLEELVESEQLTEEAAKLIYAKDILAFSKTELAARMKAAEKKDSLFREQPFIMGRPASEIDEAWPEEEKVQIQGIIDAFFIEGDKIYVVDYKTDRVKNSEILKERYTIQLDLYAEALHNLTGLEIGDRIIYSVALQEAISLGEGEDREC